MLFLRIIFPVFLFSFLGIVISNKTIVLEAPFLKRFSDSTKIFSQKFTTIKANEKHKLNLKENLPAGIYLLKVMMDGQRSFSKIVKQ